MKRIALSLSLLVLLVAPKNVYAVTLTINEYAKEISDEFSVNFSVTGAKPATNYFRVVLFKEGSHQYLGSTWNGGEWYGGSEGKRYLALAIQNGSTNGTVKGKIEKPLENGEYLLSLKRYTASGNEANDSITPVKVQILTAHSPAPSSTVVAAPTMQPKTPSPTVEVMETSEPNTSFVLAESVKDPEPEQTTLPTTSAYEETKKPHPVGKQTAWLPLVLGGIGVLCVLFGCFTFWRVYRNWYT